MNLLRLSRKKNKKVLIKRTIFVFFSFIMTIFAWFQFTKILDTNFNFHINSWSIKFIVDGKELPDSNLNINIDDIYPEMQDKEKIVTIKNAGEVPVAINYQLSKVLVFDHVYEVVETAPEDGNEYYLIPSEVVNKNDEYWEQYVIDDDAKFPFKIKFEIPSTKILPGETRDMKVVYSWTNNNDEIDTKWGYEAAKYFINAQENNLDSYPVEIKVKMFASQVQE